MGKPEQCALVYTSQARAELLVAALSVPANIVKSRAELAASIATHKPTVAFVDLELLPQLEGERFQTTIVGILEGSLPEGIAALNEFPWLSHVLTTALLTTPVAAPHIASLLDLLAIGPEQHVLGAQGVGRVALLTSSNRRESRFERMREFFTAQGISRRTIVALNDVAEELVTNALYDAPVEAGYYKEAVPRTQDVELPPEHACEVSYGFEQGSVFVRIRDPFGSLTRARLLGVLNRCNSDGVALDESRGGAGLGLWRVFSTASTISIAVIPGRLTDIVVRVETKQGRAPKKQTLAMHLCFPTEHALDGALGRFAADHDYDLMDESFTALIVPA